MTLLSFLSFVLQKIFVEKNLNFMSVYKWKRTSTLAVSQYLKLLAASAFHIGEHAVTDAEPSFFFFKLEIMLNPEDVALCLIELKFKVNRPPTSFLSVQS